MKPLCRLLRIQIPEQVCRVSCERRVIEVLILN